MLPPDRHSDDCITFGLFLFDAVQGTWIGEQVTGLNPTFDIRKHNALGFKHCLSVYDKFNEPGNLIPYTIKSELEESFDPGHYDIMVNLSKWKKMDWYPLLSKWFRGDDDYTPLVVVINYPKETTEPLSRLPFLQHPWPLRFRLLCEGGKFTQSDETPNNILQVSLPEDVPNTVMQFIDLMGAPRTIRSSEVDILKTLPQFDKVSDIFEKFHIVSTSEGDTTNFQDPFYRTEGQHYCRLLLADTPNILFDEASELVNGELYYGGIWRTMKNRVGSPSHLELYEFFFPYFIHRSTGRTICDSFFLTNQRERYTPLRRNRIGMHGAIGNPSSSSRCSRNQVKIFEG
ncbi:hypothetical protein GYMLUDRAFT_94463 [Collybiopsis luxurians FD-317 M1]|nr:hypothetical protein GYMLUDRAFT_94463 [Collybiopsis luxurians FD-317 M1]